MSEEMEILREKIHEARHNELIGYGLFIAGFFVMFTGFYMGSITETRPIVGGYIVSHPYAQGALLVTIGGIIMTFGGFILAVFHAYSRSQNIKKLEKMSSMISCPKCGKKLESKTKYCPHCGTEMA